MVAIDEKYIPRKAGNSGPQNPTVAWQGKQGYEFEQSLGLQYVRQRWYDPNTRQFISPDPLGFAGGDANLFRYAGNNPVNRNDPGGMDAIYNGMDLGSTKLNPQVGTETGGRAILNAELKSWQKSGYTFAVALLKGFLANKNGAMYGKTTAAFNKVQWQNELKNSKDYREQAQRYLSNYVQKYVSEHSPEFPVGTVKDIPAPPKPNYLYIQFYFDIGYGDSSTVANDLMYALGGQTFTFTGKIHVSVGKNVLTWQTQDLHVIAQDAYDFPAYNKKGWLSPKYWESDFKELAALSQQPFRAGYDLEHHFGYVPFSHTESWSDRFSGTIQLAPGDMNWYWTYTMEFGHP